MPESGVWMLMNSSQPMGTTTRIASTTMAPMKKNAPGSNDPGRSARLAVLSDATLDVERFAPLGDGFRDTGQQPVDLHVVRPHAVDANAGRRRYVEPQRQVERRGRGGRILFRVVEVHEEPSSGRMRRLLHHGDRSGDQDRVVLGKRDRDRIAGGLALESEAVGARPDDALARDDVGR